MRHLLASIGRRCRLRARPALAAAMVVFASLALSVSPTAAQTDDAQLVPDDGEGGAPANLAPTIAVRVGFNGIAKIGDWLPVAVQVTNEGSGVSGELQIQVDDRPNGNRTRSFNA